MLQVKHHCSQNANAPLPSHFQNIPDSYAYFAMCENWKDLKLSKPNRKYILEGENLTLTFDKTFINLINLFRILHNEKDLILYVETVPKKMTLTLKLAIDN